MRKFNTELECGALLRPQMRGFLKEIEFKGRLDAWTEIKGFFESKFLLKGIDESARKVLMDWVSELNNEG